MNQLQGKISNTSTGSQVKVDDALISLPDSIVVEEGREVVVGIRPEHLSLQPGDGASGIPISLDLVETLGSEALLHSTVGGEPLIVKAETHGNIDHLSGVSQVYAPTNLVKLFDAKTGKAITGHSVS